MSIIKSRGKERNGKGFKNLSDLIKVKDEFITKAEEVFFIQTDLENSKEIVKEKIQWALEVIDTTKKIANNDMNTIKSEVPVLIDEAWTLRDTEFMIELFDELEKYGHAYPINLLNFTNISKFKLLQLKDSKWYEEDGLWRSFKNKRIEDLFIMEEIVDLSDPYTIIGDYEQDEEEVKKYLNNLKEEM